MGSETGDTVAPLSSTSGGDDPVLLFGGLSSTDPSEPMLTLELARVRDEEGTLSETRGRELECSYPGEGRVAERFVPRMEPRGETVLGLTPFSFGQQVLQGRPHGRQVGCWAKDGIESS